MFLWDPQFRRMPAMVIGTPFTLTSAGTVTNSLGNVVGIETASLVSDVVLNAPGHNTGVSISHHLRLGIVKMLHLQTSQKMRHLAQDQYSNLQIKQREVMYTSVVTQHCL